MNRFREILFYSRRQRRALMLLCLLISFMLGVLIYIRHYMPLAELDPAEYQALIERWEMEDSLGAQQAMNYEYRRFAFDPNRASDSVLRTLGFSERLSKTIVNYTSAGGSFSKAEDLLNIYGMDSSFFEEIKQWVVIESLKDNGFQHPQKEIMRPVTVSDTFDLNRVSRGQLSSYGLTEAEVKGILGYRERFKPFETPGELYDVYNLDSQRVEKLLPYVRIEREDAAEEVGLAALVIEINSADSLDLLELKGVGPYFAGRITRYRIKLGGYLVLDQLLEIPGMDTLRLIQVKSQLSVNPDLTTRININEADFDELTWHPYISKKVARNIVRFREEYRRFKSTDELMNLELIDGVLFSKIAGYLTVDEKTN